MDENDSTLPSPTRLARWSLLAVLTVLTPGAAHAGDGDRPAAEAHRARGEALLREARFDEARAEFVAAYDAGTDPALFARIGDCHRRLKEWDAAIYFYAGYLAGRPGAPDRAEIERLVAEAQAAKAAEALGPRAAGDEQPPTPLYRRAWPWATAGAVLVAAGGAVTIGLLLGGHPALPSDSLGSIDGR